METDDVDDESRFNGFGFGAAVSICLIFVFTPSAYYFAVALNLPSISALVFFLLPAVLYTTLATVFYVRGLAKTAKGVAVAGGALSILWIILLGLLFEGAAASG